MCLNILSSPPVEEAPSTRFEVRISSTVNESVAFFDHFDHAETNGLDLVDFWGARSPYVDFHGYRVPKECIVHLEAVYSSHGDFMQGFPLGHSVRERFLKLLV